MFKQEAQGSHSSPEQKLTLLTKSLLSYQTKNIWIEKNFYFLNEYQALFVVSVF